MTALVVSLVLAPLALAPLWMAFGRRRAMRNVVPAVLLLEILALSAAAIGGRQIMLPLGRALWGSSVGLYLGGTVSLLTAAVYGSIALCLGVAWRTMADGPPLALGLVLALTGAVVASLLVDDLLARVVVLDLASVMVASLLVLYASPSARPRAVWHYVPLRVGDLAFLYVALQLWLATGTSAIGPAFEQAATLPSRQLFPVIVAAYLAAWVKLGLPPLGGWLRAATALPVVGRAPISSIGPPLLGAYLLYRLQPAIVALGPALLAAVAIATLLAGLATYGYWHRTGHARATALALHGLLGAWACLTPLAGAYILSFVPVRLALVLLLREKSAGIALATASLPDPDAALARVARLATQVETSLERAVASVTALPGRLGARMQREHQGKLSRNLLWALLALAPVLLALFLSGPGGAP